MASRRGSGGAGELGVSGTSDQTIALTLNTSGVSEGQVLVVAFSQGGGSAADLAGNTVTGTPFHQAPTITVSGTAEDATVLRTMLMYTVVSTDSDGSVAAITMLVDGNAPPAADFTCNASNTSCTYNPEETSTTPLLPGEHTFTFTAMDNEGNTFTTTRTATVI